MSDQVEGAGDPGTPLVVVTALPPYQVVHHGIVSGPNETAQVPADVAALWVECGWAVIDGDQPVSTT
ncbi:hypothetical protein BH09ACT8_BH09ACT8_61570 [soil metagenome]